MADQTNTTPQPNEDVEALKAQVASLMEHVEALKAQGANDEKITNTNQSITKGIDNKMLADIKASLENARKKFEKEKLVKRSIPKNLRNKIGPTLFLAINGVRVILPVDGSDFKIPESFSEHLDQYLANVTI